MVTNLAKRSKSSQFVKLSVQESDGYVHFMVCLIFGLAYGERHFVLSRLRLELVS
jgi:hypothetical protein